MITWLFISVTGWVVFWWLYLDAEVGTNGEMVLNIVRALFKVSTILALVGCGVRFINGGF